MWFSFQGRVRWKLSCLFVGLFCLVWKEVTWAYNGAYGLCKEAETWPMCDLLHSKIDKYSQIHGDIILSCPAYQTKQSKTTAIKSFQTVASLVSLFLSLLLFHKINTETGGDKRKCRYLIWRYIVTELLGCFSIQIHVEHKAGKFYPENTSKWNFSEKNVPLYWLFLECYISVIRIFLKTNEQTKQQMTLLMSVVETESSILNTERAEAINSRYFCQTGCCCYNKGNLLLNIKIVE